MTKGFEQFIKRSGIDPSPTGGRKCYICTLPKALRAEVEGLRKRPLPVSFSVIMKYLAAEHGFKMGNGAIEGHFRKGHDK